MSRNLALCFAGLFALTCTPHLASAQQGTSGPPTNPSNNPPPPLPNNNAQKLTEQSLLQTMQALNLNPQEKQLPNGRYWTLQITHQDGWKFVVEVRPTRNQNGSLNGYVLVSPLGQPISQQASAEQLRKILEAVYTKASPCYFGIQPGDGRLCIILDCPFNTITQQSLNGDVNLLLGKIKSTRDVWDLTGPALGQHDNGKLKKVPGPGDNPAPAKLANLAGTTWKGTEQPPFGNYGALSFEFRANDEAVMFDTDGQTKGTYSQNGQNVTLTFYNGTVVYSGTINGQTLSGTAKNGKHTWDFSVQK